MPISMFELVMIWVIIAAVVAALIAVVRTYRKKPLWPAVAFPFAVVAIVMVPLVLLGMYEASLR